MLPIQTELFFHIVATKKINENKIAVKLMVPKGKSNHFENYRADLERIHE